MSRPIVCQYCGTTVALQHGTDLTKPLLCECIACFTRHRSLENIEKQAAMMKEIHGDTPEAG